MTRATPAVSAASGANGSRCMRRRRRCLREPPYAGFVTAYGGDLQRTGVLVSSLGCSAGTHGGDQKLCRVRGRDRPGVIFLHCQNGSFHAMARPPKPTALLHLQGTFRGDRHGKRGREPRAKGTLDAPDWLVPEARAEWDRVVEA